MNRNDALILQALASVRGRESPWTLNEIRDRIAGLGEFPPGIDTIGRHLKLMARDPDRPPAQRLVIRSRQPIGAGGARMVLYKLTSAGWRDVPAIVSEFLR